MPSISIESQPELRLFADPSHQSASVSDLVLQQLPFLPELSSNFELATGWQLEFAESRTSFLQRQEFGLSGPVQGRLAITDMSSNLEAGKSVRHRGVCEQLASTLDQIIGFVQSQRTAVSDINRRLSPVVSMPFDWWELVGNAGFRDGSMTSWLVTPSEHALMFWAAIDFDSPVDSAICSTAILSTFESLGLIGVDVEEIAPAIIAAISHRFLGCRLDSFLSIDFDPITGDYAVDGFQSDQGLTLVDIHANRAIRLKETDLSGTLYPGQALGVGIDESQTADINEIIGNSEISEFEFRRIVERKFENRPAMFLYRC